MQKHVNLVDLVKSFPTNISLQNLASIQKRTSPIKFAHLAEKSENSSISNLSTKAAAISRADSPAPARKSMAPRSLDPSSQIFLILAHSEKNPGTLFNANIIFYPS